MDRRRFLVSGATGLAAVAASPLKPLTAASRRQPPKPRGEPFTALFAPHFGMFQHHAKSDDDQLQFAFDEGFRAWEDNWMARRETAEQERLAAKMQQLGITMGVFVAHADFGKPSFAKGDAGDRDRVLGEIANACEVAKRVNAKWCTVVPGTIEPRLDPGYQTANAIDLLKRCCDVIDKSGVDLCMVLEALNFRDHPNLFLTRISQGYEICRAVASPHCKLLDDLYHQQVTEGNLIPNIDRAWDEIGYYQIGDNPGRKEPGTGEVNFKNVFAHVHEKGFRGVFGMEHGNAQGGKEGERALIEAYRAVDIG